MKHGSLPHSVARLLPVGPVAPMHRPDGLTEAQIDALAAEAGIDLSLPTDEGPAAPVIPLRPAGERASLGDEAA